MTIPPAHLHGLMAGMDPIIPIVHPQSGALVPEIFGDEMSAGMTKFYRRQSRVYLPRIVASVSVAGFSPWFGIHRFRRTENSFADAS